MDSGDYRQVTVYTIGHSNRDLSVLLDLLRTNRIDALVDVRAEPRSRRYPQYDQENLRAAVESLGAVYHWAGRQLGGRRPQEGSSPHRALEPGLRGYADYMDSEAFRQAARQLLRMASGSRVAILCAEREPERCHRSLIADYLVLQGVEVRHIVDRNDVRSHVLHPGARRESAQLIYDHQVSGDLGLE